MKKLTRLSLIVLVALFALSCSTRSGERQAKYIFYFIGDGMGASQISLAQAALSTEGFRERYAELTGCDKFSMVCSELSVTGMATTHAANRHITDSAAAGTALATGSKTNVGVVGLDVEGAPLKTIAEMARDKGMKVGIISSVSLDHATPACFYAHTESRNNYPLISDQMLLSDFDYFAGGSLRWSKRAAQESVTKAEAYEVYRAKGEALGYKFVNSRESFDALTRGEGKVIASLKMLAEEQYSGDGSAMPYTIDLSDEISVDNRISLADFTRKGIELMEGDEGFFMMVEGGKIDWACHANDAATAAHELAAFDDAVAVAVAFAQQHPHETLIVVTGDHETGGLSMGYAGTYYESAFELLSHSKSSYHQFTIDAKRRIMAGASFDDMVSYACERFGFTNEVTDGSDGVITNTLELSDHEISMLRESYAKSLKQRKIAMNAGDKYHGSYGGYDPFATTCTMILNSKSGIGFTTYSHTAVSLPVLAEGVQAHLFNGYYDNTDIAKRIIMAAGL